VLLPLTLAFNLVVTRTRAPLVWLVAGNLTVFSGLFALRDVARDPRELAAASAGGTACVARVGDGWFGREHSSKHEWFWARERGTLILESWPKARGVDARLDFHLRSLTPRHVTIRQDGREIFHIDLSDTLARCSIPIRVERGSAVIEFSTDLPSVRESPGANARVLAFALYDPRLVVTEK
jgi:hypothetical protein